MDLIIKKSKNLNSIENGGDSYFSTNKSFSFSKSMKDEVCYVKINMTLVNRTIAFKDVSKNNYRSFLVSSLEKDLKNDIDKISFMQKVEANETNKVDNEVIINNNLKYYLNTHIKTLDVFKKVKLNSYVIKKISEENSTQDNVLHKKASLNARSKVKITGLNKTDSSTYNSTLIKEKQILKIKKILDLKNPEIDNNTYFFRNLSEYHYFEDLKNHSKKITIQAKEIELKKENFNNIGEIQRNENFSSENKNNSLIPKSINSVFKNISSISNKDFSTKTNHSRELKLNLKQNNFMRKNETNKGKLVNEIQNNTNLKYQNQMQTKNNERSFDQHYFNLKNSEFFEILNDTNNINRSNSLSISDNKSNHKNNTVKHEELNRNKTYPSNSINVNLNHTEIADKHQKSFSELSPKILFNNAANLTHNNQNANDPSLYFKNLTYNNESKIVNENKDLYSSTFDDTDFNLVIYKISYPDEEDLNTLTYILGLQSQQPSFSKICYQCLDNMDYLRRLSKEILSIKNDMISNTINLTFTKQDLIVRFSEYINRVNLVKIQLFEMKSNLDLLKASYCPNYDENAKTYDSIMKKANILIEIIQDSIRKQNLNINFLIMT